MASAATVMPFGLLHMRLLQRWLHDRVPRWTWRHGTGLSHLVLPPHLGARGRILLSSAKGVPLAQVSRDVVQHIPLPRAGVPCATGMQLRGSGQGPSCSGISIASSCWQYDLLCAASKHCYTRGIYWSVRTTLRPLRTSTTKVVYAPCPRGPSARTRWHTAGLGAYANMSFPQ